MGEIYQIPVEPIIDIPTYELFKSQREKNKTHPSQNIRHDYLLSGHLKCSCNLTWQARTAFNRMQQDELCLREEIQKLATERQEFITRARKVQMKDEELLPQMDELNKRDLGLKRNLTAIEQAMDAFTEIDLEEQVRKYVADLQVEMKELINATPQTLRIVIRYFC
ncbi:MAG: hypothetical protein EHM40_01080 [Chloroflexi bacterium]|nr:MAG: hypothetical protein EHM40_19920 [Chloroflexota bacterium]RPI96595.1 MAG: hypothetical protein EHM40_01080 [Chloroflexota bacterium]